MFAELQTHVCARGGCWRTSVVSEANVDAHLGAHWRALRLDFHFSSCVPPGRTVGGLCDVVAVYPQDSNNKLRLVELKQTLADITDAVGQLRNGGTVVAEKLPTGFDGITVLAELHVRRAPRSTLKMRRTIRIRNQLIPVAAYCDGRQV